MAFAAPEDVGYDPTVERVIASDGSIQYKYTVEGVEYITLQLLSIGSLGIIGGATRVWKVCEWAERDNADAPVFALKDSWAVVGSLTETEIKADIFKNFNRVNKIDMTREEAESYFIGIRADEALIVGGEKARAREIVFNMFFSLAYPSSVRRQEQYGEMEEERTYPALQHQRTVFLEVGTPLDKLTDYSTLFGVWADTAQG